MALSRRTLMGFLFFAPFGASGGKVGTANALVAFFFFCVGTARSTGAGSTRGPKPRAHG